MGKLLFFAGFMYLLYRLVYLPMQQKNAELKDALDRERMEKSAGGKEKKAEFSDYEEVE